jgi:hypothetical protein
MFCSKGEEVSNKWARMEVGIMTPMMAVVAEIVVQITW